MDREHRLLDHPGGGAGVTQGIRQIETICYQTILSQAEAHMNERDREPTALECYEACRHACACCRQYERAHGPIVDNGWREWLPEAIGCTECDEYKE